MIFKKTVLFLLSVSVMTQAEPFLARAEGTLRVHPLNPRYFTDDDGKAIYLTGSHTWATIQERGIEDKSPDFDYKQFLNNLKTWGHNFTRLWAWEHATWMQFREAETKIRYKPLRYPRTGPGKALDGGLKFDVTRWNEDYFTRLRERVIEAGKRGIYVGVMLFQGFSIEQKGTDGIDPSKGNPWDGHPFNKANNVNRIDGDLNGNGEGEEIHTLNNPVITKLQEAFVRKMIETLNDQDHVIWEISNESHGESLAWQEHMIHLIHEYEKDKAKQHPVWITYPWPGKEMNDELFASQAEAVSPNSKGGYLENPPPADGSKVVIADTDHIKPNNTDPKWVWKSFLRGLNPIVMDYYMDVRIHSPKEPQPDWNRIRKAMGYALAWAKRIDLTEMTPRNELSSTKYCLANPGKEYLVYQPEEREEFWIKVEPGKYRYEWFDPEKGYVTFSGVLNSIGGEKQFFSHYDSDALFYLHKESQ